MYLFIDSLPKAKEIFVMVMAWVCDTFTRLVNTISQEVKVALTSNYCKYVGPP